MACLLVSGAVAAQQARVLWNVGHAASPIVFANTDHFDRIGDRLIVLGGGATAHGLWGFDRDGTHGSLLVAVPEEWSNRNPGRRATNGELMIVGEYGGGFGERVWSTDGTAEGTQVLLEPREAPLWKGVIPYEGDVSLGGRIVFVGWDSDWGFQLWSTEGWRDSTAQLSFAERVGRDAPWPAISVGEEIAVLRELAGTGLGFEIWFTDGTPEGTRDVAQVEGLDLRPTVSRVGDRLFVAFDSSWGHSALYVSDGSQAGTHRVELPEPGWFPRRLVPRGRSEIAYFAASSGPDGEEVWRSDGTDSGTFALTSFAWWDPVDDWERDALALDEGVLIRARSGVGGSIGYWFARSDGAAPVPLLDLEPPALGWHDYQSEAILLAESGRAIFLASSPDTGTELWSTDGTGAGTFALTEAGIGAADGRFGWVREEIGRVIFVVDPPEGGPELWTVRPDGTGVSHLATFAQGAALFASPLALDSDSVWLVASQGDYREQVWECPLNGSGPVRRTRLGPTASSSWPLHFEGTAELFAFDVCDANRLRLWKSDGTSLGTSFQDAGGFCNPFDLRREYWRENWPGKGLVLNWPGYGGEQLFHLGFDGTYKMLTEFAIGIVARGFVVGDDLVYPRELEYDVELWRTEITTGNSRPIAAIDQPHATRYATGATQLGEGGIFLAKSIFEETELWWTDGTPEGTRSLNAQAAGVLPSWSGWKPVVLGKDAYFPAWDGTDWGLYRYRQASGEIERLTPVGIDLDHRGYWPIRFRDGVALLAADETGWRIGHYSPVTGSLRWVPLRGERGTGEILQGWAANGDVILFNWRTEEHGAELWVSDTTVDGTGQVADIEPGAFSSDPRGFTPTARGIYFSAFDHRFGRELWRSDGRVEGTSRVGDLAPQGASSSPEEMVSFGRLLALSAYREDLGREPWVVDLETSPHLIFADGFECAGPWNWDNLQ